jgi:exopolysaccharide biosynthesis polyprenyl glycosylphosphotransferase
MSRHSGRNPSQQVRQPRSRLRPVQSRLPAIMSTATQLGEPRKDRVAHAGNWFVRLVHQVNPRNWSFLLVGSDMVLVLVAFILAYWIRYRLQWFREVDPVYQTELITYGPFALPMVVVVLLSFHFSGVYRQRLGRGWLEEVYAIASATTIGMVTLIIITLIFRPLLYSRLIFLYTAILITLLLSYSRLIIHLVRSYLRQHGIGVTRVVLAGAGDLGRMVMRNIAAQPNLGYQLIGFLDDNPVKGTTDIGRFKALGAVSNFSRVMEEYAVDQLIICLPWQSYRTVMRLLRECEMVGVKAQVVPDLFQLTKNQMDVEVLNGIPLISTREISIAGWNLILKRAFDVVASSLVLVLAFPIFLIISLAIWLDSPGPIIYSQTRRGRNGVPFQIHKFRSMIQDADRRRKEIGDLNEASGPLFKMKDDPRRTRVGRFLRRFSLDELPQLINVLRGEMSLVGPRPNLPEEVAQYHEWHHKRLSVSPGITGLWQVSGRSDLTFDEMVLLDIYYAENWSFTMDLSILLRTIPRVLLGKGAY